jgi:hypothetical protein
MVTIKIKIIIKFLFTAFIGSSSDRIAKLQKLGKYNR